MKIVIVGCSRGIGSFLADSLASKNEIFRVSRTVSKGKHYPADIGSWYEVSRCADSIKEDCRKSGSNNVDALIYCAGIQGQIGPVVETDPAELSRTIDVNLKGFLYSIKAFHEVLSQSRHPKVIAFSGGGATKSRPRFCAYAASKCGLVRSVETLADELPYFDINAIAPGAIFTRMTEEVIRAGEKLAGEKELKDALKTKADPKSLEKILDLVKFLLSPRSDGISGRLISAVWHDWENMDKYKFPDAYRLRHITPPN